MAAQQVWYKLTASCGKPPQHATELCGVVEALFSYVNLGSILGDVAMFDQAELIFYNALPAAMTKDTWAHQYLTQNNGINAIVNNEHIWRTDGPYAIIYGLDPTVDAAQRTSPSSQRP